MKLATTANSNGASGGLVRCAESARQKHVCLVSTTDMKSRGQFFTPPSVARFMAGLLPAFPENFRLLDPGAGLGILTAAVCERVMKLRRPRNVHVDLYEKDPAAVSALQDVLHCCRETLAGAGHQLTYQIRVEDFLLTGAPRSSEGRSLFESQPVHPGYDAVIMNPPYFKIGRDSPHAKAMSRVIHGQPNIYSLFLAAAAECLKPHGNLVAITPRSFCNGLYFREFRQWFFKRMALRQIHLFASRTDTFREANVLQESVITHCGRGGDSDRPVVVSRSSGRDFRDVTSQRLPVKRVLDDSRGDMLVCVPESEEDAEIVKCAESWDGRFSGVGLQISTGPVVMFRAKQFLVDVPDCNTVPLLSAHNVRPFRTTWPVSKKKWPLAFQDEPDSQKHLVPTRNYVLVKRFSAKEERRRLTAGCLFVNEQKHARLALENHINYIYHNDRELSDDEVRGVAAVLNSALYDRYFRAISGNTQVNATEIRQMKFPSLAMIERIGRRVGRIQNGVAARSEEVVLDELGVNGRIGLYLKSFAR